MLRIGTLFSEVLPATQARELSFFAKSAGVCAGLGALGADAGAGTDVGSSVDTEVGADDGTGADPDPIVTLCGDCEGAVFRQ